MKVKETITYIKSLIKVNSLNVSDGNNINLKNSITNTNYIRTINNKGMVLASLKNGKSYTVRKASLNVNSNNNTKKVIYSSIKANLATIKVKDDSNRYLIPEINGLQNVSLRLIAGVTTSIKLSMDKSKVDIKQLIGLPSSLYFNNSTNTIEGIPFILGEHFVTVVFKNNYQVTIKLEVIPKDLSNEL